MLRERCIHSFKRNRANFFRQYPNLPPGHKHRAAYACPEVRREDEVPVLEEQRPQRLADGLKQDRSKVHVLASATPYLRGIVW